MGIPTEFNPDLALRAFGIKGRTIEECLPEKLEEGKIYPFLKKGQINYCLEREIKLFKTNGNQNLSIPLASITILEYTHSLNPKTFEPLTNGLYLINKVYDVNDKTIHFEGMNKIK